MPSATSKVLQGLTVSGLTTIGAFFVWTKHSQWEDIDPATDATFKSPFYRKFNVNGNPTTHDLCVRKIPIFKVDPELVEDARKGGTKLTERFCAGVWGGFGYQIQRAYLAAKYKNDTTTAHQLWTRKQLLASDYPEGTEITDHFKVLSKSASSPSPLSKLLSPKKADGEEDPHTSSILIRCGDSPLHNPDSPRPSDGLFEISTTLDMNQGFCEFRLKSILYQGEGKSASGKPPMPDGSFMLWAHRRYAELWMESAIANVKKDRSWI